MGTVMDANISRPKVHKKASKKNKRSWRKNTDIEDVEEFLEDQRLEERLGGAFDKRTDSDIFVVDNSKATSIDVANNTGVKDPKGGRDPTKTPEQRKNPILKRKEEELAKAGIIRQKLKTAMKQRQQQNDRKKATILERTTRRRTKFDFDLWDSDIIPSDALKDPVDQNTIDSNEWLQQKTKDHNLNNTRQMKRKPPKGFYSKQSTLPAVEIPHEGTSYNPSYKDHQDLLWQAAMVELNKEKEQHRIDYHTTDMFPKTADAPNEQTWVAEMSEGIAALDNKVD